MVLGTQFSLRRYVPAVYWAAVVLISVVGTQITDNLTDVHGVPLRTTTTIFAIGYWKSALMLGGAMAVVALAHFRPGLNGVAAFWAAYVLTRPLGASIGDFLSQPTAEGGLGWGNTVTSHVFLATIPAVVVYLSVTRRDVIEGRGVGPAPEAA